MLQQNHNQFQLFAITPVILYRVHKVHNELLRPVVSGKQWCGVDANCIHFDFHIHRFCFFFTTTLGFNPALKANIIIHLYAINRNGFILQYCNTTRIVHHVMPLPTVITFSRLSQSATQLVNLLALRIEKKYRLFINYHILATWHLWGVFMRWHSRIEEQLFQEF